MKNDVLNRKPKRPKKPFKPRKKLSKIDPFKLAKYSFLDDPSILNQRTPWKEVRDIGGLLEEKLRKGP